jgi:hypothetical protein
MTLDLSTRVFTHHSGRPFELDLQRDYTEHGQEPKPRGFWISDDEDLGWARWATENDWGINSLRWKYSFRFRPEARVLLLQSFREIVNFGEKYRGEPLSPSLSRTNYRLDWSRVKKRYDAIVITPYDWTARNHDRTFWYYGWDCASGCVWNLEVIEQVGDPIELKPDHYREVFA